MKRVVVAIVTVILVASVFYIFGRRSPSGSQERLVPPAKSSASKPAVPENSATTVNLGEPPSSPKKEITASAEAKEPAPAKNENLPKPIHGNTNASTKSVMEALQTKTHPERLSVAIAPKPFDRAAYDKDPQTYLNTVEPGRVFQCAIPGKDVPALLPVSSALVRMQSNEKTTLTVKGAPNAPVTLTSLDWGTFQENGLNSVTVKSDKDGNASVTFVASAGTTNDVNILAGSPMASGQVRFRIEIESGSAETTLGISPTMKKPENPDGSTMPKASGK